MLKYFWIAIIFCSLNYLHVWGICSDAALENVKNRQVMKEGGWRVDGAPLHGSDYAWYCARPISFWGFKYYRAIGFVEATFNGSGRATLDFGNCYDKGGVVKVYLNAVVIGEAEKLELSKIISFNYSKGDVLNITEEFKGNGGIIKINSLKLEECDEKDEDEDKKCEDKVTWCEADKVNCNRNQIKESCQKYCGLCKDEDKKCEDKVTWCEADNVNCDRAQIKESCQKYCGLCKDEDEDNKCDDKVTWCEADKVNCNRIQIKESCKKYCGLCKDEDEDKKCENKVTWCDADNVNCNRAQIKESCPKYCGLCKDISVKYDDAITTKWCRDSRPIEGRNKCDSDEQCLANARGLCDDDPTCSGVMWFSKNPFQKLRLCQSKILEGKTDGWRTLLKSNTMKKEIVRIIEDDYP